MCFDDRFLLDTGIAGLYLDRKRGVFERATAETAKGNRVGIAAAALAELAFRAEGSPRREQNLFRLRQALDVWKLWLVDTETAFEYGRLAFELKKTGRAIGQNDIWIAATALTLGNCTVVSSDSDLSSIPGLTVENWAVDVAGSTP
jgi:tRNA(fMet)-specific endonuclease VapC